LVLTISAVYNHKQHAFGLIRSTASHIERKTDFLSTPDLSVIRHVALDMDGTIYKGSELFPFTLPFLAQLRELGIGYTFLTNNSSKSVEDYLAKIQKMGIDANPDQMYTSALATMDYIKQDFPDLKKIYLVGTASLAAEFARSGFKIVDGDNEPDAVVVAFDTDLNYHVLCKAAWWIENGKPYIATHPDRICPTNLPTVLIDCGAICAAIESAVGRKPDAVPGKPDPRMLNGLMRRHGIQPHEMMMVGDRLYTDVAMAQRAKAVGVLVLTGEATRQDAEKMDPQPDFIFPSVRDLGNALETSRRK